MAREGAGEGEAGALVEVGGAGSIPAMVVAQVDQLQRLIVAQEGDGGRGKMGKEGGYVQADIRTGLLNQ
jgi:hypothetical protein